MVKFLLSFVALATVVASEAQTLFTGKVLDKRETPVPFAVVRLDQTNVATITNVEGNFRLRVPDGVVYPVVEVSCLGFLTRKVELRQATGSVVLLLEDVQELAEVTVVPRDRARELVQQAIDRIPQNYSPTPQTHVGFLRELVYWQEYPDDPLYVAEATLETVKEDYSQKRTSGNVKLLKSRKYQNPGFDTLGMRFYAGMHDLHRFDVVARREGPLDRPEAYQLEITDTLQQNGQSLFQVSFTQKNGLNGYLVIADSTFAVASVIWDEPKTALNPFDAWSRGREFRRFEVSYSIGAGGWWEPRWIYYRTGFDRNQRIVLLTSEYLTTDIHDYAEIPYLERFQFRDILLDKAAAPDSNFWVDHNVALATDAVSRVFESSVLEPTPAEPVINSSKKWLEVLRHLNYTYAIGGNPTSIGSLEIRYDALGLDSITPGYEAILPSFHFSFGYELGNSWSVTFESVGRTRSSGFLANTLFVYKSINLNPNGRPVYLQPHLGVGYLQAQYALGNHSFGQPFAPGGKTFDRGRANIWYEQRGWSFRPGLAAALELSHRMQLFIKSDFNGQITRKTGFYLQETDQAFFKRKSAFQQLTGEGVYVSPVTSGIRNLVSFQVGVRLDLMR